MLDFAAGIYDDSLKAPEFPADATGTFRGHV